MFAKIVTTLKVATYLIVHPIVTFMLDSQKTPPLDARPAPTQRTTNDRPPTYVGSPNSSMGSRKMKDENFEKWVKEELEDLYIPEFFPPGYTQEKCDELLTQSEQYYIVRAARFAHAGRHQHAEACRKAGGYGGLTSEGDIKP